MTDAKNLSTKGAPAATPDVPSRSALRQLVGDVLQSDSDFDAFVSDYFNAGSIAFHQRNGSGRQDHPPP
jgi:hypothetical protein